MQKVLLLDENEEEADSDKKLEIQKAKEEYLGPRWMKFI
jgi:hypothetical protein